MLRVLILILREYNLTVSNLESPFRIRYNAGVSGVQPGYLTRGLSLLWQCDFMLCATHW